MSTWSVYSEYPEDFGVSKNCVYKETEIKGRELSRLNTAAVVTPLLNLR